MRWSLRIARVSGIPVRVHFSFALLAVFLVWRASASVKPVVAGLEALFLLLIFACVALHELGHAFLARLFGVPITEITFYPFGGIARLGRRPRTGRDELFIALAGPLVNLCLALILMVFMAVAGGGRFTDPHGGILPGMLALLIWANLIIAGFNLLPAFPLDGGRVLRAALAPRLGWARATVWAASIGQTLGLALLVAGLFRQPWLALAGVLILPGANAELRLALTARQAARWKARDVAVTDLAQADPNSTLAEIAEGSGEEKIRDLVVRGSDGELGYLPAARLWSLLDDPTNRQMTVREASRPVSEEIAAEFRVREALDEVCRLGVDLVAVVEADGSFVGVVNRSALERALSMAAALSHNSDR